ncbi:MFS transporter [Plastoroseomonas arctica]|uniref:MFS transporter n=1 Tax=Plastoroseomonas arctica TaxID=1509237 RepID=A0AAF1JYX1_9PROT|nr:MFS transporter [Plastoroseomonas arctica]MBR0657067.1 MFS transporter [Plastoroseomonas arctica]
MSIILRVTLPLAGVGFLNQASRGIIATIGPLLALELGLSASQLGLLAAAVFVTYALAQMPVGLALDLFGARRTQATLAAVAGCGFLLSALAEDALTLGLGRLLTGCGVAAALMALLQATAQWFPRDRVAAMTGLGSFFSGVGALAVTLPVQWALPHIGWRGCFWALSACGFAVALWIALSVPDRPPGAVAPVRRSLASEIAEYGRIFADANFLRFLPMLAMTSGLTFTFGGLWSGPWLRDVAGLTDEPRATILLCFALGFMLGNLIVGRWVGWAQRRGWPAMVVPMVALGGQALVMLALLLSPNALAILAPLFIAFGFISAGGPAGYAVMGQGFPRELAGRVATAINFTMLVLTVVLQNAIGWVLDFWPRTASAGWDPAGYAVALGGILLLQCAAAGATLRRAKGEA